MHGSVSIDVHLEFYLDIDTEQKTINFLNHNNILRLIIIYCSTKNISFKIIVFISQPESHNGIEKYRHVPDLPSLLYRD